MADAALFEFLHTEMVAELWAQDPDPGPGGQKMSLSVLEGMGFRVGQALGERLPRETLAFREELDVLKFLCKDVWAAVFQKQMDSLRTNHQGTYVLQDNSFPLLIRMASGLQYLEEAPKHPGASPVWTLPGSATCCLMWVSTPTSELYTEAATDPNGRRRGSPQWVGLLCRHPIQPLPSAHS
ncbi:trafficking protein particle complex subunit 6A isoform X9 [Physeter macrocephalus]|uniref:Trafficking protein particle complex subunit 6A isoform X9 n=1 Tax=Physeter macrocephalus TaxID=9755 RepID=A0A9W2W847_PHYMC|nr:trafficking protein particle complex subunit 6A isoform X9 [Physeter catodon]